MHFHGQNSAKILGANRSYLLKCCWLERRSHRPSAAFHIPKQVPAGKSLSFCTLRHFVFLEFHLIVTSVKGANVRFHKVRVFFSNVFLITCLIASGSRKSHILNKAPSIAVFTLSFFNGNPERIHDGQCPIFQFQILRTSSKSRVVLTRTMPSGCRPHDNIDCFIKRFVKTPMTWGCSIGHDREFPHRDR